MPNNIDPHALWNLSYGLYIVSSRDGEKLNGQIANTVFQVAAEPPLIAIAINRENLTHKYIEKSKYFAVSVLEEAVPMTFIGNFGFKSGRNIDKFENCNYKIGETGSPLVTDYALSIIEAKVVSKVEAATHTVFIGEVVSSEVLKKGTPLTYADYHLKKKGKEPKNAPTYRAPNEIKTENKEKKMEKFVCDICGYVYDPEIGDPENGIEPGTAFENLPDDWTCPVCGADKDSFSKEK